MTATRRQNRYALRVIVGLLVFAAACSAGSAAESESNDTPSTPMQSTVDAVDAGSPGAAVDTTLVVAEAASAGLSGVSVDVTNAVAPFDHESSVDDQLLPWAINRLGNEERQYRSDCMAAEGFELPPLAPPPEREDPILISNWQFPQVDVLAVEGFAAVPGTPSSPDDFQETSSRTEAYYEVSRSCAAAAEEEFKGSDRTRAYELYAIVRGGWEEVLAEIDGSDEIRPVAEQFSGCLRDEGIPVEYTVSETHYLSYVDELLFKADGDIEEEAAIRVRYGKLYAKCGRELFEAKERLRSGERRIAFLAEHEEAIRELSDLLSGLERED